MPGLVCDLQGRAQPRLGQGLLEEATSQQATLRLKACQGFSRNRGFWSRVDGQLQIMECDIKVWTLHGKARPLLCRRLGRWQVAAALQLPSVVPFRGWHGCPVQGGEVTLTFLVGTTLPGEHLEAGLPVCKTFSVKVHVRKPRPQAQLL